MKSTLNPNAPSFVPLNREIRQKDPNHRPFVVALIGPPGSGKTTQGLALSKHFGFEFLSVGDKLRELRQVDPALDANWGVKYCSALANNLLDEYIRRIEDEGREGLVIEYIKTPDGSVIVEEACKRHGLKVDCTILLEMDDILTLTARVKSRTEVRKEDLNPQFLLSRIHEYMFVEKAFLAHYARCSTFFVVDSSKPCPQVTKEVMSIVDKLKGTNKSSNFDSSSDNILPSPMSFVPVGCPFLTFVNKKSEVMDVLTSMQGFIGLNTGRERRFPGSSLMTLDEAAMRTICTTDGRYMVSKKVVGTRYLMVYLKGSPNDESRFQGCYLVDRAFAVFRVNTVPEINQNWGDMLLDGCLVPLKNNKAAYIAFDCLYYDGLRTLPESLDSRIEHMYSRFPPEGALEHQLNHSPPNSVVVVHKQYLQIKEFPRLAREFDQSFGHPYTSDGLIFTPKKNGYKTNFDPNLFKWKPIDRCAVDFRLVERRQGGFDLLLARLVGKELKEMPYDRLEPTVQRPQFMNPNQFVGSIVQCRPLQVSDNTGSTRTFWQIVTIRTDKITPDREDVATSSLQSPLDVHRLVSLYHQYSQTQPEPQPVAPIQHGYPTLFVASPTGPPFQQQPIPGGVLSPMQLAISTNISNQQTQSYQALAPQAPNHILLTSTPARRPADTPPPPPNTPISATKVTSPVLYSLANMGSPAGGSVLQISSPSVDRRGVKNTSPTDNVVNSDSAVVQYGRISGDNDGRKKDVPSQPLAVLQPYQYITSPTQAGAMQLSPLQGLMGVSPTLVLAQNAYIPVACVPQVDSQISPTAIPAAQSNSNERRSSKEEIRGRLALHELEKDMPSPGRGRERMNSRENKFYDDSTPQQYDKRNRSSPSWDKVSPSSAKSSPGAYQNSTHIDFTNAVKEWLIRKFVPRPSAARPRPYSALEIGCGNGSDIGKWDKNKASYLVGCDVSESLIEECKTKMGNRDTEMVAEFIVADGFSSDFNLPTSKTQLFDVVAMFFCLENAFESEQKASTAISNASKFLKSGGVLLITTIDSEVLTERIQQRGGEFGNSEYQLTIETESPDNWKQYGIQYNLEYNGSSNEKTYIVSRDLLRRLASTHGLETLPHEHGWFNFHDVAAYIEKSVSKGHMVNLTPEQLELTALWCTYVLQKPRT